MMQLLVLFFSLSSCVAVTRKVGRSDEFGSDEVLENVLLQEPETAVLAGQDPTAVTEGPSIPRATPAETGPAPASPESSDAMERSKRNMKKMLDPAFMWERSNMIKLMAQVALTPTVKLLVQHYLEDFATVDKHIISLPASILMVVLMAANRAIAGSIGQWFTDVTPWMYLGMILDGSKTSVLRWFRELGKDISRGLVKGSSAAAFPVTAAWAGYMGWQKFTSAEAISAGIITVGVALMYFQSIMSELEGIGGKVLDGQAAVIFPVLCVGAVIGPTVFYTFGGEGCAPTATSGTCIESDAWVAGREAFSSIVTILSMVFYQGKTTELQTAMSWSFFSLGGGAAVLALATANACRMVGKQELQKSYGMTFAISAKYMGTPFDWLVDWARTEYWKGTKDIPFAPPTKTKVLGLLVIMGAQFCTIFPEICLDDTATTR